MTVLQVCAVRDAAMGGMFAQPMFVPATGVAIRSFASEVNRADERNMLYHNAGDFELWHIGQYQEETGEFLPPPGGPRCLTRGLDVRQA